MKHNLRTVKMPDDKIKPTLDKHFSKTYPNGFHGYRGAGYTESNLFLNPQKLARTSKDSNNLYYVLMDTLPSYKDYPSRSKSLIFTNKEEEARKYNPIIFQVYPSNYAKLAVADAKDEFISLPYAFSVFGTYTFSSMISDLVISLASLYLLRPHLDELKRIYESGNMTHLREWIEDMQAVLSKSQVRSNEFFRDKTQALDFLQTINNTDYTKYIKCLSFLYGKDISYYHNIVLPYNFGSPRFMSNLISLLEYEGPIMDILDDAFNPKKNNIRLMNVSEATSLMKDTKTYEIWTDSLCFLKMDESDEEPDTYNDPEHDDTIDESVNYKDFYKDIL
jgi:hypothetical protein